MPQRFLKPGLPSSEAWDSCSWITQSFYVRLITLVDDYGRFEAAPTLLRSLAFPLREDIRAAQVSDLCHDLAGAQLAFFYKADGKAYFQLTKWTEKPRAEKSKYPAFDSTCEQMFADVCKCWPYSSSSSSSPPYASASSPPTPSPAQAQAHFAAIKAENADCDYKADEVKAAWLTLEATKDQEGHWTWGKKRVGDWRAALEARIQDHRDRRGQTAGSASIQQQIKSTEALIADCKGRLQKLHPPNKDLYPAEHKQVMEKRGPLVNELAELDKQLKALHRKAAGQ